MGGGKRGSAGLEPQAGEGVGEEEFLARSNLILQRKKAQHYGHFLYGGGGLNPHSIAFGGVFPNITVLFLDENSSPPEIFTANTGHCVFFQSKCIF